MVKYDRIFLFYQRLCQHISNIGILVSVLKVFNAKIVWHVLEVKRLGFISKVY